MTGRPKPRRRERREETSEEGFLDLVDELPGSGGDDIDLRRMFLETSSEMYSRRRQVF